MTHKIELKRFTFIELTLQYLVIVIIYDEVSFHFTNILFVFVLHILHAVNKQCVTYFRIYDS